MIIYVIKNPKPGTVAVCFDKPTQGAEAMEEKAFIEWRDSQEPRPEDPTPEETKAAVIDQIENPDGDLEEQVANLNSVVADLLKRIS